MMSMWWRAGFLALSSLVAVGCTKLNPNSCESGVCSDPALPYCDVTGAVSGTPKSCIAVACTPNELQTCDGDTAITCNATGDSYDDTHCDRGCEPGIGCRVCQPSQTVCANGAVQTCDASGAITSSQTCPLGCFENQPRCRDIDPSNGLAQYLDMVVTPPDVSGSHLLFNTTTGTVSDGATSLIVPNFLVAGVANGAAIRVFIANDAHIQNAEIQIQRDSSDTPGPGFALVARGSIEIAGTLLVDANVGVVNVVTCVGGQGTITDRGSTVTSGGGGGGGNGTDGAAGGSIASFETAGLKGAAHGLENLVPLHGGCSGGTDNDSQGFVPGRAGLGGGAVQLSAGHSLAVTGTVDVRGQDGLVDFYQQGNGVVVTGGGAGGSMLLESPSVSLGATARLLATGGAGGAGCTTATASCGLGGAGATRGAGALPGSNAVYGTPFAAAGGGGGGLGRIRINTPDQSYAQATGNVQDGVISTGTLGTR